MSSINYYEAEKVRGVLTWPLINKAVEEAMKAVANKSEESEKIDSYAHQSARSLTQSGGSGGLLFTMPSFVGNYKGASAQTQALCNTLSCKLVTSFPANQKRAVPLPNIMAHVLLFSTETGRLETVLEGTQITAWRTAGASIVATKYLYFGRFYEGAKEIPPKERPINVAIIGCGAQGESHALGFCDTFNVPNIYLWNRTKSKALLLEKKLKGLYPATCVHVADTAHEAVAEADVICVGTFSPTALVDHGMLKKTTVHINTVGAGQVHFGEVAQDIYDKAKTYVDSWANAESELKGLKATIVGEVGEAIRHQKYPQQEGITVFQSMGMAAEDATVAQYVAEKLEAK